MVKFTMDLRALKAAAIAASVDEARYYLKGVCVEYTPEGPVCVATDGHRLIAVHQPWQGDAPDAFEPVIVPLDLIKRIKIARKDPTTADVTFTAVDDVAPKGFRVSIDHAGATYAAGSIAAVFPSWRNVIPQAPLSGQVAHFQAHYVASFLDAIKALGKTDSQPAILHNGDSPALVDLGDYGDEFEAFGVLMPYRMKRDLLDAPPAWARPKASA